LAEASILDKPITLASIFVLQERVLHAHIEFFGDRYQLVANCLELVGLLELPESEWESIPLESRIVFNYFRGDSISTLISATRLALHGCETDAYALMRVVLESLTVFSYIVSANLFSDALREIQLRSSKGKAFSSILSYKTAIRQLDIKDRRDHLRGQMSTIGSHLSPSRLAMSRYLLRGAEHVKAGMSLAEPSVKIAFGELASLSLFAVRVTDEFLSKLLPHSATHFHRRRVELDARYEALASKGQSGPP
jgi:hypothetical protein